jgi:hypothetical protein
MAETAPEESVPPQKEEPLAPPEEPVSEAPQEESAEDAPPNGEGMPDAPEDALQKEAASGDTVPKN